MQVFFPVFWWIYFCIFFTGYPLIYSLLYLSSKTKQGSLIRKMYTVLPVAYALVGTGFWILMLCLGHTSFVVQEISSLKPAAFVIMYSFTVFLFWFPVFRKKDHLSLLHSLPLFLLPPLNMLFRIVNHEVVVHEYIINMLRIYSAGFIVYLVTIAFILLIKQIILSVPFRHRKA